METFTVSAKWMKACGKGDEAKTFPVIRSVPTLAADSFFGTIHTLDLGNGATWDVAEGRRAKED